MTFHMLPGPQMPSLNLKTHYMWRSNLNSSDSARLHRTISLMYVGARHLEFGITFHKVT